MNSSPAGAPLAGAPVHKSLREFEIAPNTADAALSIPVTGRNHLAELIEIHVVTEKPLTIFLNSQEIVTLMTIGDYPELLAAGYLLNQGMIRSGADVASIEHDPDLDLVVVRTEAPTDFEEKLKKKIRTSGCAQGTVFGDLMEEIEGVKLSASSRLRTSWLYVLQKKINTAPSLYLKAGAIHGCVLCERDRPLIYMEDVGRHNAVDKIAGYMALNNIPGDDKIFYTTGRLTSEMIIKTVKMEIPILASRSGFTAWGVELARRSGLTLIGRMRGRRFVVLSGEQRLIYDQDVSAVEDEDSRHRRKGSFTDDE
jgi:FdhD protein